MKSSWSLPWIPPKLLSGSSFPTFLASPRGSPYPKGVSYSFCPYFHILLANYSAVIYCIFLCSKIFTLKVYSIISIMLELSYLHLLLHLKHSHNNSFNSGTVSHCLNIPKTVSLPPLQFSWHKQFQRSTHISGPNTSWFAHLPSVSTENSSIPRNPLVSKKLGQLVTLSMHMCRRFFRTQVPKLTQSRCSQCLSDFSHLSKQLGLKLVFISE